MLFSCLFHSTRMPSPSGAVSVADDATSFSIRFGINSNLALRTNPPTIAPDKKMGWRVREANQSGPSRFLSAFGSLFRTTRELILTVLVVTLIGLNVATVASSAAYDLLHGAVAGVSRVLGAAATHRLMNSSLKAREARAIETSTKELQRRTLDQERRLKSAEVERDGLRAKHGELERDHRALMNAKNAQSQRNKALAGKLRSRLAKNVVRNTAALTAEAVPFVGLAAAVGVTAYDVYDACQTIQDLNQLLRADGQSSEDTNGICGVQVPTVPQVLASLRSGWRTSIERTKLELAELHGRAVVPELRAPTTQEVLQVTCPVIAIKGLCK